MQENVIGASAFAGSVILWKMVPQLPGAVTGTQYAAYMNMKPLAFRQKGITLIPERGIPQRPRMGPSIRAGDGRTSLAACSVTNALD